MQLKSFFSKNWIHFVALGVFLITTVAYFSPEFNGFALKQHDVEQFRGMANETHMFREQFEEEPLWTNSMFGGMPTTQISVIYNGNVFQQAILWMMDTFGVPTLTFFLHLIGFYLLALCLRLNPVVAVVGALAFAFATYEIVIIQAGHNSKAITVALTAPVIGAFILAYRSSWKWGILLSAFFMSFQLASNHLQVTYYMGILLFGLGLYELFRAVRSKEFKLFGLTSIGILAAYGLALFINFGNITLTQDYAKHTIRGGNDLTIAPDGTEIEKSTGLDKDYITNWSYGVGESFTLVSPYVKGSASAGIIGSQFQEMIENSDRTRSEINQIFNAQLPMYWGEQPIVSGPTYVGVVMVFLMILGLIYVKDRRKWVLFGVAVLALMLSWGKNFMGLTDFFIDHVPGYNKFRTVTIIMILIELIVPIIGIFFLDALLKDKEEIKANKKPFLAASGIFFVFLLSVKMIGLGDGYSSSAERSRSEEIPGLIMKQLKDMTPEQLAQNNLDLKNTEQIQSIIDSQIESYESDLEVFKGARQDIFHASMNRSLLFAFLIIGLVALYFYTSIPALVIVCGAGLFVLIDLVQVDLNYLNNEEVTTGKYKFWIPEEQKAYPLSSTMADLQILDSEIVDPTVNEAVEKGKQRGVTKAQELGYTGVNKSRVVDAYKFSALNFATNYRVFSYDNPWGSSRASYFHKNLGGYHGAKLRNIQNVFEFHLSQSNNKVFDMLNVKYFIQGESVRRNPTAMGQAWMVRSIKQAENANDEIRKLGAKFRLKNVGTGQFLVNEEPVKEAIVYGGENLIYVQGADSIKIPLTNGMSKGLSVKFVKDAKGVRDYVMPGTLEADTLNSFQQYVELTVIDVFEPAQEAVMLKSEAEKLSTKEFSGQGSIKMESYRPNKIVYAFDSPEKQLVVFSEIYYPDGWKAFIDGKEVEIRKVNYLLRGLEVDKGAHKIEFSFHQKKYEMSETFAPIGTVILFGIIGFALFMHFKSKRKLAEEEV